MLSLSPHKLAIFRQCHRRYKYHYVDGLLEAYRTWWPFYTMGAHVHAVLSRYLAPLNGVRDLPKLESLLQEQWPRERRGFASRDEERDYYLRGRAQLHWFFHHEDREVRPQMLEAQHSVPLDAALRLLGKVDRVDKLPDGTFQIVDYKTSRTSAYADDFQLRAYALLLTRRAVRTMTVMIPSLVGGHLILWGQIAAAGVVAVIPGVVLCLLLQRFLIRGLTLGAIKG